MAERLQGKIWVPTPEYMAIENAYVENRITELGTRKIRTLIKEAVKFRDRAYTSYSHYDVGAAILTGDGKMFGGCNSESVAYSPTNHAEGVAIAKANSEGYGKSQRKFIEALAVCHDGDSGPCGECLQRMVEHADNCLIIVADPKGEVRRITSLKAIFPYNFNPSHLGL